MEAQNLKMKLTGKYDLRYMAGTYVLMPAGNNLLDDMKKPLIINEVTASVVEEIGSSALDQEEILSAFLSEYNVGEEEAREAIKDMLELLTQKEVLEPVGILQ